MGDEPIIKACVGPPRCDGASQENCAWCVIIDPFDEGWESRLSLAEKGN